MSGDLTARHSRRARSFRRRSARGLALATGAALGFAGAASGLSTSASADVGTRVYDLSSEAVAVQSTATDPSIPLGLPFTVGSYGASSLLNSNGESASDAGAPYSPLVSSLPNTGNGVAYSAFGAALPVVPTFPGYVSAKDPVTPLARQSAGGYELTAAAGPDAARGTVSMGAQAATSAENNAFAYVGSLAGEGAVQSEAAAGVHALTLDGILDLANFSSYASLTRDTDGTTVPFTRTDLGTISFAGLTSGLTGAGFGALGSDPIPVSADGLDALNEALKPAGVTLTYLPAAYSYTDGSTSTGSAPKQRKTVAGLVSGALQIVVTYTGDRGTSTETITIGRVAVNATSTTVGTTGSAAGSAAGTGHSGAGPAASVGADGAAIGLPGVAAGAAPGSGLVGAASTAGVRTQTFAPAAGFQIDPQGLTSFDSVYLVLALSAGIAVLAGQVVRLAAVRLR